MNPSAEFTLRLATEQDIPALHALIEASVRGLQAADYTQPQIEGALGTVLGLDTQLIKDRTYFVAEAVSFTADPGRIKQEPEEEKAVEEPISESFGSGHDFSRANKGPKNARALAPAKANPASNPNQAPQARTWPTLAGCGGWSKRKTLFGADRATVREPELLNPETDAAKVRAIFVHPYFARQGLGSLILATVEKAAHHAGFRKYEMGSTLTGVPLYQLKGYVEVERIAVPLHNGEALPVVKMVKESRFGH